MEEVKNYQVALIYLSREAESRGSFPVTAKIRRIGGGNSKRVTPTLSRPTLRSPAPRFRLEKGPLCNTKGNYHEVIHGH
jgi:hypothetical protein